MQKMISTPVFAIMLILAFGLASQAHAEGQPTTAQAVGTIIAAAVAALAAIFGALLSFGALIFNEFRRRANDRNIAELGRGLQERLTSIKHDNDVEIARVSAELKLRSDLQVAEFNKVAESRQSAEAARREYEFEARKRLYHECEPLLFQISQLSSAAIGRIISLARAAREGELTGNEGLLGGSIKEDSGRGYYYRSTLYHLLAPLAEFYILRTRLTLADISLDFSLNRQFLLSDAAYKGYTRDFDFAAGAPEIVGYRETADRVAVSPCKQRHKKQGVFLGRLDNVMERFIMPNSEQTGI
jgi:hypothetical protein